MRTRPIVHWGANQRFERLKSKHLLILIINLVHQVMKMVMTLSAPESGNVTWCLRPGAVLEMGTLMGTLGKYFILPF